MEWQRGGCSVAGEGTRRHGRLGHRREHQVDQARPSPAPNQDVSGSEENWRSHSPTFHFHKDHTGYFQSVKKIALLSFLVAWFKITPRLPWIPSCISRSRWRQPRERNCPGFSPHWTLGTLSMATPVATRTTDRKHFPACNSPSEWSQRWYVPYSRNSKSWN